MKKLKALIQRIKDSTVFQVFHLIFLIGVMVLICIGADGIQKKKAADQQLIIDQQQEIQALKAELEKAGAK